MRREGALHVPLDTARKGWARHYTPLTYSTYGTWCMCVTCTHVCAGLHTLLGGLSP